MGHWFEVDGGRAGPRGGGPLAASSAAGPPADSGTDTTLDQIGASLRGLGVGEPGSTPPGLNLGMLRGAPGGGGMSGSLGGLGPGAGGPAPGASEWYAHLPDDLGLGGGGGAVVKVKKGFSRDQDGLLNIS